jgi:RsiW-degrading membrane proteinase PrsW (M82 family)
MLRCLLQPDKHNVEQVAPVAFKNIGWKFYMVFISCCVASATIMYFTFPDTLNKPLEKVAAMF